MTRIIFQPFPVTRSEWDGIRAAFVAEMGPYRRGEIVTLSLPAAHMVLIDLTDPRQELIAYAAMGLPVEADSLIEKLLEIRANRAYAENRIDALISTIRYMKRVRNPDDGGTWLNPMRAPRKAAEVAS